MTHTIDDAIYNACDKSYNPNLSKNQWLNLLNDKEIFTENSLKLLKRILHSNGKASCAELAAIYGGDANLYNRNASALGQRVYKKTNCTLYSSGKDFYLIVFTGSYNSDNRYDFILRPELWNALEELGGENGVLLHDVPLYERGEKKLNVYKFKIMIKIYKELLKDYKDLYNEQYKWSLLTNFNGKPNLDDEDFIKDFKRIFRNNLSSLQAQQFANELLKNHLDEYKNILRYLYDEKIDLVERLKFFKEETSRLLGKNSNQDERFASVLLTVKYPEKYTFYKKENAYDDFCSYLYIETEKSYNRYKHYLEILNQLEKYVEQDKELVELNKEFTKDIDNCFYSNKLLIQDILFILFGWQRGAISTQTYIFPFSKERILQRGRVLFR